MRVRAVIDCKQAEAEVRYYKFELVFALGRPPAAAIQHHNSNPGFARRWVRTPATEVRIDMSSRTIATKFNLGRK